jgi:hypothetical protein
MSNSPSRTGHTRRTAVWLVMLAVACVTAGLTAIGAHGKLLDLGLNNDPSLQVPGKPLQAGWFHDSPTPGQNGPAVILGHVDSYTTGPAAFYKRRGSLLLRYVPTSSPPLATEVAACMGQHG